jgi:rod shape-determining protein MreD
VRFLVVAGACVLMLLHFVLHVGFGFRAGAPDLSTLGLLVLAREVRMGAGAGVGFVLGLLEDALNALAFGTSTVAMTVVGAAASRTRDLFVGESATFVALYLFVGKWVRDGIQWLMTAQDVREPFERALLVDGAVASVYVALVGLVLVRVFGNWLETGGGA